MRIDIDINEDITFYKYAWSRKYEEQDRQYYRDIKQKRITVYSTSANVPFIKVYGRLTDRCNPAVICGLRGGFENKEIYICRISMLEPKYILDAENGNSKLRTCHKDIFIELVTKNWHQIIEEVNCFSEGLMEELPEDLPIPDYSQLETIDE